MFWFVCFRKSLFLTKWLSFDAFCDIVIGIFLAHCAVSHTNCFCIRPLCNCPPLGYKYFIHSVGRHKSIPRNVRRDRSRCGWSLLVIIYY